MTITGDLVYRRTQIAWPTVLPLLLTAAVRTDVGFVVVNFKDPERTRALYADLAAHLNRSRG